MSGDDLNEFRIAPPEVLYRRFGKKEHAESFAQGDIRMKNLLYYREVEDLSRRDDMEGVSSFGGKGHPVIIRSKSDGKVVFEGKLTDDILSKLDSPERYFISCFSMECNPDHRKWGEWVVALYEPEKIFVELSQAIGGRLGLMWAPVEYCDTVIPTEKLRDGFTWRRKRHTYASEREFRLGIYVGSSMTLNGNEITITLKMRLGAAKVFRDAE